jgi:hypothetical protein
VVNINYEEMQAVVDGRKKGENLPINVIGNRQSQQRIYKHHGEGTIVVVVL